MSFLRHYDLMIPSLDSGSRTKSFSTNYPNYNVISRQNDVITDVFMFSVLVGNSNYKCPIIRGKQKLRLGNNCQQLVRCYSFKSLYRKHEATEARHPKGRSLSSLSLNLFELKHIIRTTFIQQF